MTTESIRTAAERRLEEDEARSREKRLAALEREEEQRREDEAERLEREREREAARKEAVRLAGVKADVEDEVQEIADELVEKLRMLENIDREQREQVSNAGLRSPKYLYRFTVQSWLDDCIVRRDGSKSRAVDPSVGKSLRERDEMVWQQVRTSMQGGGLR